MTDHQAGITLVMVLCWIVIVTSVIVGLMSSTSEQAVLLRAHRDYTKAFYLANTGLLCAEQALSQQKKPCQTISNLTFTFSRLKPIEQNHYELLANAHYGKAKVSVVSRVAWVAGAADVERLTWRILPQKLTQAMP